MIMFRSGFGSQAGRAMLQAASDAAMVFIRRVRIIESYRPTVRPWSGTAILPKKDISATPAPPSTLRARAAGRPGIGCKAAPPCLCPLACALRAVC